MAVTESTRPRLWVQPTVFGNWYLVVGQSQKPQQNQPHPNRIRAFSRSFAALNCLYGKGEVRA
jgi:hypothetical protein